MAYLEKDATSRHGYYMSCFRNYFKVYVSAILVQIFSKWQMHQ